MARANASGTEKPPPTLQLHVRVQSDGHAAPAVRGRNQPIAAERVLRGAGGTSSTDLDHVDPCEDQQRSRDDSEGAAQAQFGLWSVWIRAAHQKESSVAVSAFVSSRRDVLRAGLRH